MTYYAKRCKLKQFDYFLMIIYNNNMIFIGGANMSTITLRFDDDTKSKIDKLCDNLGLSITNFFTIYAKKAIQEQGIPFSVKITDDNILAKQCKNDLIRAHKEAINNGTADMSLDEINKIIYGK